MVDKLAPTAAYKYRWAVSSRTDPSKKHVVSMKHDGTWACACGGWIFQKQRPRGDCFHIGIVKDEEPPDTSYTPTIDRNIPRSKIILPHEQKRKPSGDSTKPYFVTQTRREISFED